MNYNRLDVFAGSPLSLHMTQVISCKHRLHKLKIVNSCLAFSPQLGASLVRSHCVVESADDNTPQYCIPGTQVHATFALTAMFAVYFSMAASPTMGTTPVVAITLLTCAACLLLYSSRTPSPIQTCVTSQTASWHLFRIRKSKIPYLPSLYTTTALGMTLTRT